MAANAAYAIPVFPDEASKITEPGPISPLFAAVLKMLAAALAFTDAVRL